MELFETDLGRQLSAWGVELNSAEINGVLLPTKRFDGWKGAIHNGGNPKIYLERVNEVMGTATNKEEALDALNSIRNKLKTGEWQLTSD